MRAGIGIPTQTYGINTEEYSKQLKQKRLERKQMTTSDTKTIDKN